MTRGAWKTAAASSNRLFPVNENISCPTRRPWSKSRHSAHLWQRWIGDLFYKPPTFSGWYDWLRLGGFIFFPTAIPSYFIMRKNLSAEQEKQAYIVLAPIILLAAALVTVALYFAFE
jgi:hypothetical protein